jgi:hypothetical protein
VALQLGLQLCHSGGQRLVQSDKLGDQC